MRTLEKAIRTAMIEKGSWKQQLYQFLRHYWATPHSTVADSPAELLYKQKLRTELPAVPLRHKKVRFEDDAEEILRHRDARQKQYMKELADKRNNARHRSLMVGQQVLVKQEKKDKLTPPYDPRPYTVIRKAESQVTA